MFRCDSNETILKKKAPAITKNDLMSLAIGEKKLKA
ncbi:hypothetical protein Vpro01_03402 [Vibrio proteolyticus]